MMRFWWTPLLLVGACVVSRPYGSFDMPSGDDQDAGEDGSDDDGTDDGDPRAVPIPRADGGMDARVADEPLPPGSPLAPYVGTYLMRMDMYSSLTADIVGTKLVVKNRISNLILTEIRAEGDRLVGQETFCHQTYEHNCTSACVDGWTTTPDPGLAKLFPNAQAPRAYRLDGDQLVADEAIVAVGFTEKTATKDTKLPAGTDDARLWKPKPNGVGFITRLKSKVKVSGLTVAFDCEVSAANLFGSAFQGPVGDGDAPLEGARFPVTLSPLPAVLLAAVGTPSSYCSLKALNEQEASADSSAPSENYVRFRKTDISGECPTVDVFEDQLPADAP